MLLHTATRNRRLVKKRAVDLSGYKKFWEMREQCSVPDPVGRIVRGERKVFRCAQCGGVTRCEGDYEGAPDLRNCSQECQATTRATMGMGSVTPAYREKYEEIRWDGR